MRLRWWTALIVAFGLGWLGGVYAPRLASGAYGPSANSYYIDRLDFLRGFPMKAETAMLGDSLTQYGDWSALFPGQHIANLGISGEETASLLRRLDTVEATGANRIFLLVGVNDIIHGGSVDETFARYRVVLERLRGRDVTVQSVFPTRGQLAWANGKIRALNALLSPYCAVGACAFVDLTPAMSADGELRGDFTNDGLHLNANGYRAWRDAIAPVIVGAGAARASQ